MLLALLLLQGLPQSAYPAMHLTSPSEWVDAGHVAPYGPGVLARARGELAEEPPPEPVAATASGR